MKRVVRSLLLFFCTTLFMLSASVCVCVVRVHADGATYYQVPDNECWIAYERNSSFYQGYKINNGDGDYRAIIFEYNNQYWFDIISLNSYSATYYGNESSTTCPANPSGDTYSASAIYSLQGSVLGYKLRYNSGPNNVVNNFQNIPVITLTNTPTDNDRLYYTFGEGAVDPVEPINWGQVDVEGYQTNVAGQGQASINNVDVITWNNSVDTNGNDITEGNVRIRFIPGQYSGATKNELIQKLYTDFILDIVHATDGNVYPVSSGSASFKWSDVINTLNLPFPSFYSLINENDAWIKRGWIYEIRLEVDDYIGEWQPIYASTSSGVENDLQIVNTTVITQDTITAIQNINSLNGTVNIWIVNGQPVDPNPEQEPPASDNEKPWWVYLLEIINNTLGIQNEYINEGTDESIQVVNNFEGDHTELNTTVNDYDDIENDLVLDMNNNLEQIEVESDLIENNSFLSSARWVAEQYTTIVTDNPIGSILKFSLVLGFVMIFLGRFK